MAAEAIGVEDSNEIIELFGPEALVWHRRRLQDRLGQLSALMCDATRDYHDCINEIIKTNSALAAAGVDTDTLGREIQVAPRARSIDEVEIAAED